MSAMQLPPAAEPKEFRRTQILSVVCVVDERHDAARAELGELHRAVTAIGIPIELIVVLNSADPRKHAHVRSAAQDLDSVQVYVMKRRVDFPTALLAGVENSIGDWVATLDLGADDPGIIAVLFSVALRDDRDLAVAVPESNPSRSMLERTLAGVFHRLFRLLHGYNLTQESPSARLLSRAVVNELAQQDSPLIAFETLLASSGYRKATVKSTYRKGLRPPLRERTRTRWRTFVGAGATPLRIANLLCATGAMTALAYSVYVVLVYFLKDDVVPGWTTLSIIISIMFLMLSLVLWMLSEYMLMLLDTGARRARYEVAEEFTSTSHPRRQLLNVETEL